MAVVYLDQEYNIGMNVGEAGALCFALLPEKDECQKEIDNLKETIPQIFKQV